jgi:hypothetical protein
MVIIPKPLTRTANRAKRIIQVKVLNSNIFLVFPHFIFWVYLKILKLLGNTFSLPSPFEGEG